MKFWKMAMCLGLLLTPALIINPNRLANLLLPVDTQSLSWVSIDLAELSPGEARHQTLDLHNNSWREIQLASINSDCGCLVVQTTPLEIPPRSSKKMKFSIHAPDAPGVFHRSITFGSSNFPELAWQVDVTGCVEADVWAEPARLAVELRPGEVVEELIAIRHLEDFSLGTAISSSERVQIIDSWPIEDGRMLKLSLSSGPQASETSTANLRVFAKHEPDFPCLEIPVKRDLKSPITFLPASLDLRDLDRRRSTAAILNKMVVVTLEANRTRGAPQIESLVPWVRLEVTSISPLSYELGLKCDVAKIPTVIDGPIILVSLPGGESQIFSAQGSAAREEF